MDDLIELLKTKLQIPEITEDDVILDGSMIVTPLMSGSLKGNGANVSNHDYIRVYLFFKSKKEIMEKAKLAVKTVQENHMTSTDPDYEFEKEGKIWRALFTVQVIGG